MKRIVIAALAAGLLTGCSPAALGIGHQPSREERYIAALKDRGLPLKDDVEPEKAKDAALATCDLISADVPQWMIADAITEKTDLDGAQALAYLSVTRTFYCPDRGSS